jgi:hypothetical protein
MIIVTRQSKVTHAEYVFLLFSLLFSLAILSCSHKNLQSGTVQNPNKATIYIYPSKLLKAAEKDENPVFPGVVGSFDVKFGVTNGA